MVAEILTVVVLILIRDSVAEIDEMVRQDVMDIQVEIDEMDHQF